MLTLTQIREERDQIIGALSKRGIDVTKAIDNIISLDQERRSLQKELDDTLAKSNTLSRQIGELMKAGERDEAEGIKSETSGLKQKSASGTIELSENEKEELFDMIQGVGE